MATKFNMTKFDDASPASLADTKHSYRGWKIFRDGRRLLVARKNDEVINATNAEELRAAIDKLSPKPPFDHPKTSPEK